MKVKKIIIPIFFLIALTGVSYSFAANIGNSVYGVFTETYNGVVYDDSSTSDGVEMWGASVGDGSTDRMEGSVSQSVGTTYWFGVHFDSNQNMSAYSGGRMYFSAKVPASVVLSASDNKIAITDSVSEKKLNFNNTNIKRIDSAGAVVGTGITNDNVWHTYYIDLANFGLSNWNIVYPFVVGSAQRDRTLLIDNVYWKKSTAGTFDAKLKTVSGNVEVSSVTWNSASLGQGWTVADQYIEMTLDSAEFIPWSVKIYTVGGSSVTTNGLKATTDATKVLPMCWRVNDVLLPVETPNKKTLTIAESSYKNNLYDGGAVASDPGSVGYWCWFRLADVTDTSAGIYSVVWNTDGFHAAENSGEFYGISGSKYPKIYLGANFKNALSGLTYRATVKLELANE